MSGMIWGKPDAAIARACCIGPLSREDQAIEDQQMVESGFWIGKVRTVVRLTLEDLGHIEWGQGRFMPVIFDMPGPDGSVVENTRGAVVRSAEGVFGVSKTLYHDHPGLCPDFNDTNHQTVTGDEAVWEGLNVKAIAA